MRHEHLCRIRAANYHIELADENVRPALRLPLKIGPAARQLELTRADGNFQMEGINLATWKWISLHALAMKMDCSHISASINKE